MLAREMKRGGSENGTKVTKINPKLKRTRLKRDAGKRDEEGRRRKWC
jgi:hypothetical protein